MVLKRVVVLSLIIFFSIFAIFTIPTYLFGEDQPYADLTVTPTSKTEGNNLCNLLQATFSLPSPLKPGSLLSWEMSLFWISHYSQMEIELLNPKERVVGGLSISKGGGNEPASLALYKLDEAGKKAFVGKGFSQVQSPYHLHRQYRLERKGEGLILSIQEGKMPLWQSDLLSLGSEEEITAMRLNLLNDKTKAEVYYDNDFQWLRFSSVADAAHGVHLSGTLRAVKVLPANDTRQLDEEAEKTLRAERPQKPNWALLPPIGNPYFIACYGMPEPPDKVNYQFPYQNLETSANKIGFSNNWWLERKVLPLVWMGTWYGGYSSVEEYFRYYVPLAEQGFAGMVLDEIFAPDEKFPQNHLIFEACRLIKERYPRFFIAVHACGGPAQSTIEAAQKGYIDLILPEFYTYVPKGGGPGKDGIYRMLQSYRAGGVLEKVVPHFGWIYSENGEGMTPESLESLIRFVRKLAPETPGICLYTHFPLTSEIIDLLKAVEQLTYKYFIEPAPKVQIKITPFSKTLSSKVKIEVEVVPSVSDREVKHYKIFIDEQMVAREKEFIWDTAEAATGEHIITAQVVTSDWMRGVAQVIVETKK